MSLPKTEDFSGAAGALAGNWTQQCTATIDRDGSGTGTTSGADPTNGSAAYWSGDAFTPDQYAQLAFGSGAATSAFDAVSIRATGSTSGTRNLYQFSVSGDPGATVQTRVSSVVAGVPTTLADYAQAWAAGDVIYLEAKGTSILVKRNGVALGSAITDSTLVAGFAGIVGVQIAGVAPTFDNWQGGNLQPFIAAGPNPQTVAEGQSASFSVTAVSSGGVLHYQWKDDGVNVGSDSSTYSPTVSLSDSGSAITVVVTDDNGSTTSGVATLTVTHGAALPWFKA